MQLVAEAEGVQHQEQVHLADPELDVAALRALLPPQQPAVAEVVGLLGRVEHADLVDPAAEVGADADVGRGGHQPWPDRRIVGQPDEQPAEGLLRARRPCDRGGADAALGTASTGRAGAGRLLIAAPTASQIRPAAESGSKRSHSSSTVESHRSTQLVDLRTGQQRRVVERIAGDRQPPPLHRVGEDDARPVGHLVAGAVGVDEDVDVVAAEVLQQRGQVGVVGGGETRRHVRAGAVEEPLAQLSTGEGEHRLVALVRHLVDVLAQRPTARTVERALQPGAVLGLDDVPPRGAEELHQLLDLLVRGRRGRGSGGWCRPPTSRCRGPARPGRRSPPRCCPRRARRRRPGR